MKTIKTEPITILIVDDEVQIQKLLTYGLKEQGFETFTASSGEECLTMIANQNPSCVLLDVGLPRMSGLETLKEIRSFSAVPVLMLTVEDDDDTKVQALDLGADDYVTKPFSMPVLRARIKAILRRKEKMSSPSDLSTESVKEFSSAHLRVDFISHKIWVSAQEVHLTVTEFELLTFFIENRGKVVTHQSILAKIWGDKAGDQMHYLRVYINNLRRKIELNPSIPKLIITEVGIGYRFEAA